MGGKGNRENNTKEYCECGGSIHVAGLGKEAIFELWQEIHSGFGHQERVTAPKASRIRTEKERAAKRRLSDVK